MAAFAPIPSARVSTTVIASPLVRPSERSATFKSRRIKSNLNIVVASLTIFAIEESPGRPAPIVHQNAQQIPGFVAAVPRSGTGSACRITTIPPPAEQRQTYARIDEIRNRKRAPALRRLALSSFQTRPQSHRVCLRPILDAN